MAYLGYGTPSIPVLGYEIFDPIRLDDATKSPLPSDFTTLDNIELIPSERETVRLSNRNTHGWALDAHKEIIRIFKSFFLVSEYDYWTEKYKNKTSSPEYNQAVLNEVLKPIFAEGDPFGFVVPDDKEVHQIKYKWTYRSVLLAITDLSNAHDLLTKWQSSKDAEVIDELMSWLQWSYGSAEHPLRVKTEQDGYGWVPRSYTLRQKADSSKWEDLPMLPQAISTDGIWFSPNSLLSWCWMLLMRDFHEEITYQECEAWDCNRLIPSQSLPTSHFRQGRAIRFCGNRCTSSERNYKERDIRDRLKKAEARLKEYEDKQNGKD